MDFPFRQRQAPFYRLASLHKELFWIYDGHVLPENRTVLSDHRVGYWVWLLRKGRIRVKLNDRQWEAGPGQWIVSPQGRALQEFSDDARILSLHFQWQWPTGDNLFSGDDAEIWNAKQHPRLERSAAALCRVVQRHLPKVRSDLSEREIDYRVFLRFELRFQQWLLDFYDAMIAAGRTLAQAGHLDDRLIRATKCLHQSPLEEPFPASRLLQETGLGRAHLDRLFFQQFGVTTRVYWDQLREAVARRSLETTRMPVKQVSYQLGFRQMSHFTRWFSQRAGMTPTAFREKAPSLRTA